MFHCELLFKILFAIRITYLRSTSRLNLNLVGCSTGFRLRLRLRFRFLSAAFDLRHLTSTPTTRLREEHRQQRGAREFITAVEREHAISVVRDRVGRCTELFGQAGEDGL